MRTTTTWEELLQPGLASAFFDRNPLPSFDPAARGYSPANAWWLAELCRLLYRHDVEEDTLPPTPLRSSFLTKAGLRQVEFFVSPKTDTQAYLVESVGSPLFAALVFRGTENAKDFLIDLKTIRTPVSGDSVSVHEGFLEAFESVWPKISTKLDEVKRPLFFTGHSLGAALATLAASRRAPQALYTFGSPLVGNDAFVSTLKNVAVYRVVDDEDGVAHVPPTLFGFSHAGELHHLKPLTKHEFSLKELDLELPPKLLADHAPINYIERIV